MYLFIKFLWNFYGNVSLMNLSSFWSFTFYFTVLDENIIIPPFNLGVDLSWAGTSRIKERDSTQNVFHPDPLFFSFLLCFFPTRSLAFFLILFQFCNKSCSVIVITLLFRIFLFPMLEDHPSRGWQQGCDASSILRRKFNFLKLFFSFLEPLSSSSFLMSWLPTSSGHLE